MSFPRCFVITTRPSLPEFLLREGRAKCCHCQGEHRPPTENDGQRCAALTLLRHANFRLQRRLGSPRRMAIIPDIVVRMVPDSPAIALRITRTPVHWGVPPPAPAGRKRNNPGTINAPLCRNTMLILGDLVRSEHGRAGLRSGPREPMK